MKTNLFMALAFAFLMLFAACTEEKIIYVEKNNDVELLPGEGVIKISLSNSVETKAARPITGDDATNNVNRIAFVFFYSDGKPYYPTIAEGTGYTIDKSGAISNVLALNKTLSNNEEIVVHFEDMPEGSWKIVAIGYNSESGYDLPYEISVESGGQLTDFNEKNKCIKLIPKSDGESMSPVEEIFAGISSTTSVYEKVNEFGNFVNSDITITITRQVAGLLAYLSEVPAKVKVKESNGTEVDKTVKKVTISTPFNATGLYVPYTYGIDDDSFGNAPGCNGAGSVPQKDVFVFTHLLTFDIPTDATIDGSDCYEFNVDGKKYVLANENVAQSSLTPSVEVANTLFGSCFVIPYNQHYGGNYVSDNRYGTLHICYYDEDDNLITYRPLRIEKTTDSEGQTSNSEPNYEYDIKCNHFYSIGSLPDEPLPINLESGSDNLKVIIDTNWTESHNMTNK